MLLPEGSGHLALVAKPADHCQDTHVQRSLPAGDPSQPGGQTASEAPPYKKPLHLLTQLERKSEDNGRIEEKKNRAIWLKHSKCFSWSYTCINYKNDFHLSELIPKIAHK